MKKKLKIRNPGSQLTGSQQNPSLKDQLIGDYSGYGTNEVLAFDKFRALPKLFIKRKNISIQRCYLFIVHLYELTSRISLSLPVLA